METRRCLFCREASPRATGSKGICRRRSASPRMRRALQASCEQSSPAVDGRSHSPSNAGAPGGDRFQNSLLEYRIASERGLFDDYFIQMSSSELISRNNSEPLAVEPIMGTSPPTAETISVSARLPVVNSALAVGKPVASAIHTIGLLAFLAGGAYFSFLRANVQRAQVAPNHHLYLPSLALEWAWFGYVLWGVRKRGISLRELIGPRWSSAKQVFTDIRIAVAFQISALFVLAAVGYLLHTGSS